MIIDSRISSLTYWFYYKLIIYIIKGLFEGYVIKDWLSTNFKSIKYRKYNVILILKIVKFY